MNADDLDRILASEPGIEPSADFAPSVMRAVRAVAAEPAALAFPWRRALPGLCVAAAAIAFTVIVLPMGAHGVSAADPYAAQVQQAVEGMLRQLHDTGAAWIVLALMLTLVAAKVPAVLAQSRAIPAH